jgi:hypothetical protein
MDENRIHAGARQFESRPGPGDSSADDRNLGSAGGCDRKMRHVLESFFRFSDCRA